MLTKLSLPCSIQALYWNKKAREGKLKPLQGQAQFRKSAELYFQAANCYPEDDEHHVCAYEHLCSLTLFLTFSCRAHQNRFGHPLWGSRPAEGDNADHGQDP